MEITTQLFVIHTYYDHYLRKRIPNHYTSQAESHEREFRIFGPDSLPVTIYNRLNLYVKLRPLLK